MQAQDIPVKLTKSQLTVKDVLGQLEKQTRFRFAYDGQIFDISRKVVFPGREMTFAEALEKLLEDTGFRYVMIDEMVVISPMPEPEIPVVAIPEPEEIDPGPSYYVDPDTGDTYIPTDVNVLSAKSHRRTPRTADSIELKINSGVKSSPFSSHELPVYAYLPEGIPTLAFKTNLLHWAAAGTLNLGVDIGLGRHTSIDVYGANNSWDRKGSLYNNKKLVHWMVQGEFRYWISERFKNLYVGANVAYGQYNVGKYNIPGLFKKDYRYDGSFVSVGAAVGYDLLLTKWLNLEFSIGAGAYFMDYKKFDCERCDESIEKFRGAKFGLTRAGVSLVFIIK